MRNGDDILPAGVLVAVYHTAVNEQWPVAAKKFFDAMLSRRDEPEIDKAITEIDRLGE